MWKYIRLNLFVISKRVSTWLIPIFFILVLFCVTGLPVILHYGPQTKTMITHTDKMYLILPFIMMIVFVSTKVLNIFKDPEEDGTELMIASKPITRTKIIFGKFLTLYILIALFSFVTFLFSLLIAQVDKRASTTEVLTFSLSMGFGTWIISMLLSAIIIFFSSTFGKIGAIVSSLMVPLIFALTSTSLMLMTQVSLDNNNQSNFAPGTYAIENNKVVVSKQPPHFIKDQANKLSPDNTNNSLTLEQRYNQHSNHWYQYAAYADIWTQLTTFYYIFNKNEPSLKDKEYKWRNSGSALASSVIEPEFLVKVKRHTFYENPKSRAQQLFEIKNQVVTATIPYTLEPTEVYSYDERSIEKKKIIEAALTNARTEYPKISFKIKNQIKDWLEDWANEYTNPKTDFRDLTTTTQRNIMNTIPAFFGDNQMSTNSKEENSTSFVLSYLMLKLLQEKNSLELNEQTKSVLFSNNTFTSSLVPVGVDLSGNATRAFENKRIGGMTIEDQIIFASDTPFQEAKIQKLTPYKYAPDLLVYLAWPAITILLSALIILKYMKRDFK